MKIKELYVKDITPTMEKIIEKKLNELDLKAFIFKDHFSIKTSVSCFKKDIHKLGKEELNHLLFFIGEKDGSIYFCVNEIYIKMKRIEVLNKEFSNNFIEFDNYISQFKKDNERDKITQSNSISHNIGRGLCLTNNHFKECYIVYLDTIGVFKFEKNEFGEFKKIIDEHKKFIEDCIA
jgi:hypothetical protein